MMQQGPLKHRPSRASWRIPSLAAVSAGVLAAALTVAPRPAAAQRQNGSKDRYIDICTSVKGAACVKQPAPDTPVPAEYQTSYRAYLAMKKAAHGGRRLTWSDKPDWSGLFNHAGGFNFDPQPTPMANAPGGKAAQAILDHCSSFPCEGWITAALTPKYALQFRQKLTAVAHGYEWDQLSDCLPAGYPRFLLEPVLRRFVVTPQETFWINEWQSETRHIYTDGRGHIPEDQAYGGLWEGDSIGFWDGDTLVVHTIRMKPEELQRNQPSISDAASTIERIHMVDPNTIEDDVTLWDPKALKKPWHGVQRYTRATTPGIRMNMYSCEENNNVIQGPHGGSKFILPGETVTVQRHYRNPDNIQNQALDKAIAYGAKLMKQEEAKNKKQN